MRFLVVVLVVLISCSWVLTEPIVGDLDLLNNGLFAVVPDLLSQPISILRSILSPLSLLGVVFDSGFGVLTSLLEENLLTLLTNNVLLNLPVSDALGNTYADKNALVETLFKEVPVGSILPLIDNIGSLIFTKAELLASLLGEVVDLKECLLNLLLGTAVQFPITDSVGNIVDDIVGIIKFIINAVTGLKDDSGAIFSDENAVWQALMIGGLQSLEFSITDATGRIFQNQIEFLKLFQGIIYPITGADGGVIKNIVEFITALLTRPLSFPYSGVTGIVIPDFISIFNLLLSKVVFPLTTAVGVIIANKIEFLFIFVNGFLKSIKFPLFNDAGLVLANAPALLIKALSNLQLPIKDFAGESFITFPDFLSALFGGKLGIPNLSLSCLPNGNPADALSLLKLIFEGLQKIKLPITDKLGLIIASLLQLLEVALITLIFPLKDALGKIFINPLILIQGILEGLVQFPLTGADGTVIKALTDLLILLINGIGRFNYPLATATLIFTSSSDLLNSII